VTLKLQTARSHPRLHRFQESGWESGGVLDHTLVVWKVYPANPKGDHKAEVVYSWGSYVSWFISTPAYRKEDGEIKDGVLTLRWVGNRRVTVKYQISEDQKTLVGTYTTLGSNEGTFTKVAEQ